MATSDIKLTQIPKSQFSEDSEDILEFKLYNQG